MTEKWVGAPGFPDYEVSNLGRARRSMTARQYYTTWRGRPLSADNSTGYTRINIRAPDGKPHKILLHRLVALAFIGWNSPGMHVNHKDGNKLNNRADNLEWVTPAENVHHAWSVGLSKPLAGQRHGMAKLSDADVDVIRRGLAIGVRGNDLAAMFNVTESTISHIKLNKNRSVA